MNKWTKFSIAYWAWVVFTLSLIWILDYPYWVYVVLFVVVPSMILMKIFIKPEMFSEKKAKP